MVQSPPAPSRGEAPVLAHVRHDHLPATGLLSPRASGLAMGSGAEEVRTGKPASAACTSPCRRLGSTYLLISTFDVPVPCHTSLFVEPSKTSTSISRNV